MEFYYVRHSTYLGVDWEPCPKSAMIFDLQQTHSDPQAAVEHIESERGNRAWGQCYSYKAYRAEPCNVEFTPCGDYLTLASLEALALEAEAIRAAIVAAGGMARKSAVEDILMSKYNGTGLDRYWAHQVLNHCEYNNMRHRGDTPDLAEWADHLAGADIGIVGKNVK